MFRVKSKDYFLDYISFMIQCFIRKGFRMKAVNIVHSFLYKLKRMYLRKGSRVLEIISSVFEKYVPVISFVPRKVAATVYTLPWFINRHRAKSLFVHWFLNSAMDRSEIRIVDKLYYEFIDLSKGYGRTARKVEEYYTLAIKNRPFMRFLRKRRRGFLARLKKFGVKI